MMKRVTRLVLLLLGASLGVALAVAALNLLEMVGVIDPLNRMWGLVAMILYICGGMVGVLLAIILMRPLLRGMHKLIAWTENLVQTAEPGDFLFGAIGVILGLIIAFLITSLFSGLMSLLRIPLSAVVFLLLGYVGGYFGSKRWRDLPLPSLQARRQAADPEAGEGAQHALAARPKLMDTSVIIDGRVLDIARTGFLEGPLLVPPFVLAELRHIADSPDDLRRKRGRRGLDMLHALQKDADVRICEEDEASEGDEVDNRLLRLAASIGAAVLTTDFNLNKVAKVSGVPVLNINELAGAVKPVMMAGEGLSVQIVKEGKEHGQGIAYLEDGTMIVIENGRECVGKVCNVTVTSTLQTAAGRMIFARI